MQNRLFRSALFVCACAVVATMAKGQSPNAAAHLPAFFGVSPWELGAENGNGNAAANAPGSAAGNGAGNGNGSHGGGGGSPSGSVPMSSYTITATKTGKAYSGTIVGGSPWASPLVSTSIHAVVVPLKVTIGSSVFDPTVTDSCTGTSALASFTASPLVVGTAISYDGTPISAQYIDGFRQAEFSSLVKGTIYSNPISFTFAPAYALSSTVIGKSGTTYGSGCSLLGILSYSWLDSYLRNTVMPSLRNSGVISPTSFVIFLMKNVVQSNTNPPSVNNCCILGYHGASGSPVQTYSPVDWDTTGLFGSTVHDASVASHEIGEWMDDPLGTNPTPAWGGIGQVSSCQSNLEVGDPLSGTDMPLVNGYHLQELAYFSWYFNAQATSSLGTGGKFSSNGTFAGPAKACPPGGTY